MIGWVQDIMILWDQEYGRQDTGIMALLNTDMIEKFYFVSIRSIAFLFDVET